jgi:polyisoprenoid-binding protein YceI
MAIDTARLNERLDRFVTDLDEARYVTAIDRSGLGPIGTWVIDRAGSSVSFTWRKLRLWTVTGRLRCFGVIHLDDLPPIGVIRFQQASGLPVLTIALDPASIQPHDGDLDAVLGGPKVVDVQQHSWWTLRSESLEILPTGTWRVMATLTARGAPGLVELRLEVDLEESSPDRLVLRGQGVLDRPGTGIGKQASTSTPQIRLDLTMRARRVRDPYPHPKERGKHMHNQHAGLSQLLAEQRISHRHQHAAAARLAQTAGRPRRRRWRWLARRWWQLTGRPAATAPPAVHHPHPVS